MKNMNFKNYLFMGLVLLASVDSFSQGLKITGFGGYTIQDKVYGYNGEVIIRDGAHFGGMLSYEKSNNMSIDFTYLRQETTFSIQNYNVIGNSGNIKGSVNYYMLGTTGSPDFSAKVSPYGGIMLGAAVFAPSEKYSTETYFAVGGKLGAILHANDKVGIIIQTQLMVPVQGVGLGVGCGGGGCGSGVSTSSSATQLGFTGGVEIKLNK
jgi:hypothetical protein